MEDRKSYPLGILLIHGVGQQERGETVPYGGEPLHKWLKSWLEGRPKGQPPGKLGRSVFIEDTRLVDRIPSEGDAPPYSILHFQQDDKTIKDDDTEWVVAESWWAHELMPPKFDELLRWGLGMGPWMLNRSAPPTLERILDAISYRWTVVRETVEANSSGLWRALFMPIGWLLTALQWISLLLVRALSVLVFYFAGFIAQLLLLALQVLSVVPGLGGMVASIQSSLSGGLAGDAFLIASSPMRLNSAVSQIQRDIEWLKKTKGCEKVAIIAHSGGASIAYKALTQPDCAQPGSINDRVELFVSYGSGLSKLGALEKVLGKTEDVTGILFAISPLLLVGAVISFVSALYSLASGATLWGYVFLVGTAVAFGSFLRLGVVARKETGTDVPKQLRRKSKRAAGPISEEIKAKELVFDEPVGVVWKDYFALADVITDGRIRIDSKNRPGEAAESIEISNLHSIIKDHDSYWRNEEEFTSEVARDLSQLAGVNDLITREDEEVLKRAKALRHNRVYTYLSAGLLSALSVPLLWFGLGDWLVAMGAWVRDVVGGILSIFNNSLSSATSGADAVWAIIWGMVSVAVLAVLWFRVALFPTWRLWSREEREDMFKRDYNTLEHGSAIWFYILACVLPLGTTVLLLVQATGSSMLTMDIAVVLASLIKFFINPDFTTTPTDIALVIQWILIVISGIISLSILVGVIASWHLRTIIYDKKVNEKTGKPRYEEILAAEGDNPVFEEEAQNVVPGVPNPATS